MASSKKIGNIYAELSVRDKMSAGIKKADTALVKLGKTAASIGKGLAIAAPVALFAGLAVSMRGAIKAGADLDDVIARTGSNGEGLFKLGKAFDLAGVGQDRVSDTINRLQKQIVTANPEFEKLGLNILKLGQMDSVAAFRLVGETIGSLPDATARAASAMAIFGKSGGSFLPLFTNPQIYQDADKAVGRLGKTLSDNAEKFGTVDDAIGNLELKLQQIGAEIASELLPTMVELAAVISSMDLGAKTKEALDFAKGLKSAADSAGELLMRMPGAKAAKGIVGSAEGLISDFSTRYHNVKNTPYYKQEYKKIENPLSNYNEGIMVAQIAEAITGSLPEYLRRLAEGGAEGGRGYNSGVPGMNDMMDALARSSTVKYDDLESEYPERSYNASDYQVNSMQQQGLSMGGENVITKAQRQIDILQQMLDLMKQERSEKESWE